MAAGLSTAKSMKDRIRARLRELVAKSRQKNSAAGKKEPRRLRLLKIAPYLDANLLGIKVEPGKCQAFERGHGRSRRRA
jgi:hypothetical protein